MVAPKLQQFQKNLKFLRRLWRLVFPMLFGPSDAPPPPPKRAEGISRGARYHKVSRVIAVLVRGPLWAASQQGHNIMGWGWAGELECDPIRALSGAHFACTSSERMGSPPSRV